MQAGAVVDDGAGQGEGIAIEGKGTCARVEGEVAECSAGGELVGGDQ